MSPDDVAPPTPDERPGLRVQPDHVAAEPFGLRCAGCGTLFAVVGWADATGRYGYLVNCPGCGEPHHIVAMRARDGEPVVQRHPLALDMEA